MKDKKKKEYNQRIRTNNSKICILESNPNGVRTKEFFGRKEIYSPRPAQKGKVASIDEINNESITNIIEAIGTLKANKINLNLRNSSIRKLNFFSSNPSKSVLLSERLDDTKFEKNMELFNKPRLCESFCEKHYDSKLNGLN